MIRILVSMSLVFFTSFACTSTQREGVFTESQILKEKADSSSAAPKASVPIGLMCLLKAYPELLASSDANSIYWKDGTEMIYDDGVIKTDFETMLNQASLKDHVSLCYPKGEKYSIPLTVNNDPGRIRYEPFFYKMYGPTPAEVRKKLVPVIWLPRNLNKTIMVTTVNGIDMKIGAISNELDMLPPEFMKYLANPGGTFNWRTIAGTNRQSTHSFGMTIDINVSFSDYWRNDKPDKNGLYKYKNRIPMKIVEIFEKHGFIWGGKWYHYDTMHFEYRPELLVDDCLCKEKEK